ncbi:MAG: c-type cytochrome, partial [Pseudomonadota bacterium]
LPSSFFFFSSGGGAKGLSAGVSGGGVGPSFSASAALAASMAALMTAIAWTDAHADETAAFEALPVGDAAAGETLYNRGGLGCKTCHTIDGQSRPTGPTLAGIFGRTAGTGADFRYSKALQESEIVWTPATLNAFLENPRTYIPRNRMAYAGLRNPQDRANMIAYLIEVLGDSSEND